MSTNIDLHADKGSTFSVAVNVENKDGSAFDCTGYNVRGQVRKTYKSEYGVNLSCDYIDQADGLIGLSLTSEETAAMKAGRYYYDAEIFSDSGTVIRVLEGIFEVSPRVISETSDLGLGDNTDPVPDSHALRRDNPHQVAPDQIGLGNVDNTADATKPVSGPTQAALNLKADQLTTYTKTEVDTKVTNLIDSAPGALNTLNELAEALGDDENFASTVNSAIASNSSGITALNSHALSKTNPHDVSLEQLTDVDFLSNPPAQGQGILYDTDSQTWVAADIEGGTGTGGPVELTDQTHSIYVSKTGNNINQGLNIDDAKLTITSAVNAAQTLIAEPGFVGSVRIDVLDGGRYFEGNVNISDNIHVFAPTSTFIGNLTIGNNSSCVIDTHYADTNTPGSTLVNFVNATNSYYTANTLDMRGEAGSQTGGIGIRSEQSINRCKVNIGEIYIPTDAKGYQSDEDGNLTFGRVNLTGDNSFAFYLFGVDGNAKTDITCGEIIASPIGSNTMAVYCNTDNSKTTLICGQIDVAKVYSIPKATAELYIICPKINGDRTQNIIGVVKEISDITFDLKADQTALTAHVSDATNPHSVTATQVGLGNVDNTSDATKPVSGPTQNVLSLKANLSDLSNHINDLTNPHSVTAAQVGLGNVDNTSDINKPVSTATQTALNSKANSSDLTTHINDLTNPHSVTATQVGLGNVDNTSDATKPVSGPTQTALNLKANSSDLTTHINDLTNPHSVTAAQVGLGNVNNTSDINKPVSTATQTALNLKADQLTTYTKTEVDAAIGDGGGGDLTADVTSDVNVGSISTADVVTSGTTLQEFVEQLLKQTYFPTFVNPSASLTDNLASSVEAGTTGINLSAGFNAGAINGALTDNIWDPGLKQANRAGAANSYEFSGTSIITTTQGGSTLSQPAVVITDGANTFNVSIDYAEGPQPLDSVGSNYLSPLPAGSVVKSLTVNGRRRAFYGTNLSDNTSAGIRALSNSVLNPGNGSSFTINIPAGAVSVNFSYPNTLRNVTSVLYAEGLNADVKGSFGSPTLVDVEGANGFSAISYKVYSFTPPSPFEASATYTVTI